MGQVFRAEDTRLRREVAIKVLPAELAGDPERIARMQREAQVLASLEHPNIAAIYGLEEANVDGSHVTFLAMQLAEGETLADRIQVGPIPLNEALQIALQVAQGLEAAHERGVIHRDLKPANIQLGSDGAVKLLDFGLAKSLDGKTATSGMDLTASPTVLEATRQGVILGTAAYMSPEQARGYKVDQRTDIWAFGAVLYEMLAGRAVFGGDTATDVLGGIVHKEPEWDLLPDEVPKRIRRFLDRCLRKDPKRRLQAIGDARVAILEYLEDPRETEKFDIVPVPGWQRWLPWGVAAAMALVLVASAFSGGGASAPETPMRTQSVLTMGTLFQGAGTSITVSPIGDHVVVTTESPDNANETVLWSRRLDDPTFTVLADGYAPFFSPDGEWVGFVTAGALMKVPITGGTPLTLTEVSRSRGASWGTNGMIVFTATPQSGLSLVSQEGGTPEELTTLDEEASELTHRWPSFLPDGENVLFTSLVEGADFDRATIEVVNTTTRERKVVHRGGSYGRYLPTGHLVYFNAGTLFAVPFDLDSLTVSGSAVPVVNAVEGSVFDGNAQFDVSGDGLLVYQAAAPREVPEHVVQWVDRDGEGTTFWDELQTYAEPRVSRDGTKAAVMILAGRNWDLWTYDIGRDVATRLTFEPSFDGPAVWSPDSQEVIYSSDVNGNADLYRRRADGSGLVMRLTEAPQETYYVSDWSRDGRYAIFTADAGGQSALQYLDLEEEGSEPQTFLEPGPNVAEATFAPNGRWVAYHSRESGQLEVYVRPFPPAGGKWQVSDAGGAYPHWAADGSEIYYRNDEGIVAVSVDTGGSSFTAGRPRQLFRGSYRGGGNGMALDSILFAHYDVAPDGRFLMFPAPPAEEAPNVEWLQVVSHWFTELNRRVPTDR
jgi:serine/threonine protein kinase/Tol biopolymer transport system component